jgi:hypothetical protein
VLATAAVAVMTVGAGLAALTTPAPTTAIPTAVRSDPLPTQAFTTSIRTGHDVRLPVMIGFATPMDPRSVAGALRIDPPAAIGLDWEAGGTRLLVTALSGWRPDTYYVVTVGTTARDLDGRPLGSDARAAFLTRPAAVARLAAPTAVEGRVGPHAALAVTVEGVVDPAVLARAIRIEPPVAGHVGVVPVLEAEPDALPIWRAVFTPRAALPPDTAYTLSLDPSFLDVDGKIVRAREPLVVRTATVPTVVRFRPFGAATGVGTATNISLRFDQAMERSSTERALAVTVSGRVVAGEVAWAEGDTILVFDPATDFAEGARVTISVGAGARSAGGYPLAAARAVSFTTLTPPAAIVPSSVGTGSSGSGSGGGGGSGGGSVGSGSWTAIEQWYLGLMNCNRAGGLVSSSGGCSDGPGGVRALKLDAGISSKVTRPYARVLALKNACGHHYDGSYADRLRRGGYGSYSHRGENVGCYNGGSVRAGVLWAHRQFQSERSYRGGHWVNIMNPNFDRAGIGVWVANGRIRLVVDFFRP